MQTLKNTFKAPFNLSYLAVSVLQFYDHRSCFFYMSPCKGFPQDNENDIAQVYIYIYHLSKTNLQSEEEFCINYSL